MNTPITASILYNYVQCPQRVYLDFYGDPSEKDRVSPFVELLWERGNSFEHETMGKLAVLFADLHLLDSEEKERRTLQLIQNGEGIIYGGRVRTETLLGEPDLLVRRGNGYVAGDIKSGAGREGINDKTDGKLKKHYAVQLALYTDILDKLRFLSPDRLPFIWDVHGQEIAYDLESLVGKRDGRSCWNYYKDCLKSVLRIQRREEQTLPALCSACKLCHWRSYCRSQLNRHNDLTLIPELGRAKRDTMSRRFKTVRDLAQSDLAAVIQGKKTIFPGISAATLRRFQARAGLLSTPNAQPYITESIVLPDADIEIFFDVETDPFRDCCYLHGFLERDQSARGCEKYHAFFADKPLEEQERRAFKQAMDYLRRRQPCVVYYYSPYEKTTVRKLQRRFPEVASEADIETLFSPGAAVDLYTEFVKKKTEWPINDYSIKTLATYLGFKWRDTEPSGAASIEWYHRWVATGDVLLRQRILDYNEDDCIAMRVLLDGLRNVGRYAIIDDSKEVDLLGF
ncbi:MAG: TM0106 family RecB-like putative nuclease [Deltaproteobacteria bacterium]|nr:TM0106 family RecB-like putative nuclease [Deltaproteobacteria bacterium]